MLKGGCCSLLSNGVGGGLKGGCCSLFSGMGVGMCLKGGCCYLLSNGGYDFEGWVLLSTFERGGMILKDGCGSPLFEEGGGF